MKVIKKNNGTRFIPHRFNLFTYTFGYFFTGCISISNDMRSDSDYMAVKIELCFSHQVSNFKAKSLIGSFFPFNSSSPISLIS